MPNQPAANTRGHYISGIPDDLWAKVIAKAARAEPKDSASAICRRALEDYAKEEK